MPTFSRMQAYVTGSVAAELAVEKGATTLLMPISARKQLFDLPDALATKISIEFYADPKDAFLKALAE